MNSQLMGRAEAAEVELVKSIFHSVSTNMLCSDWGQSDRWIDLPTPPPSVLTHAHAHVHTSAPSDRASSSVFTFSEETGLWFGLTNGKNTRLNLRTETKSLQVRKEVTKVIL